MNETIKEWDWDILGNSEIKTVCSIKLTIGHVIFESKEVLIC